jgi:hypothetical protein
MQDTIWITRDGQRLLVSQMEERHIHNCIAKIKRSRVGWRREYLDRLELEITIRRLKERGQ